MSLISPLAKIGYNVNFGTNVVVGDHVEIGDNSTIGNNTIIQQTIIGPNAQIESNCHIGYGRVTGFIGRDNIGLPDKYDMLELGGNILVREGATLYVGSKIAANVKIHHKTLIRENSIIGEYSSIGSMTELEGKLTIGRYSSVHSRCIICMGTVIEDYVFMAPMSITTNSNPIGYKRPQVTEKFGAERGPTIGSGCQIAVQCIISPGVKIGHECLVVANTVVTKDFEPLSIIMGTPAVRKGTIEEIHRLPLSIREELGLK
jgi:UDP-3-O-[3-hydroxymyristoyl] glucosamine N-acyltransferase